MTPRERAIKAIQHQETDYLPYTVDFCGDAYEKLVRHYNGTTFLNGVEQHIVKTSAFGFPRENKIGNDIYQDAFGTQWDRSVDKGVGVIVSPLFTEETFDRYEFPDPTSLELYRHIPNFIEENKDKFIIASVPLSYFERSWAIYGMENVLIDMAVNEDFMFKMLDKILEYNLKLIDQLLKFDIDCVHINDDYGQQKGLIMGPALWRKYFKPGLKQMYDKIKSAGKYVYHHSCGDLVEIIPDFIELGVDILNPFQPESMDVFKVKEEYGKYITFHGGVSEQKTMALGTPDEVEKETYEKIIRLGKGGGYILGPSQEITRDVPIENVERFIKVITSQNCNIHFRT
jgi:uroporphyrinogen decarboxylase